MKKLIAKLIGLYYNVLVLVAPRYAGKSGFYLFCTPRRAPLKAHHQKFLESSERSTFDIDDMRIQVYSWGSGPRKVLFLHGWESHTFRWKNYIEALSPEEFTVYALDAPAHGYSGGDYLNMPLYSKVVEAFLLKHPGVDAVVSHSLGGFTALYTFFRYPMPVKQLVVMGTPGEVTEFVNYYRGVLGLSDRALRAIRNAFEEQVYHLPEYYSAAKFARGINMHGLIIHDEQDLEAPYLHALDISKAWKNARLVTTSGLGHNLRSPGMVKEVVDFLKTPVHQLQPEVIG